VTSIILSRMERLLNMRIGRYIAVALSLYSKIPVPHFAWEEDDMKYCISFLPLVGLIITLVSNAVYYGLNLIQYNLPSMVCVVVFSMIPLIIAGGFHVDGFMDCQDAFHSYGDCQKKLEILKDPHIGAFSVIHFVMYCAFFAGAMSLLVANGQVKYFVIYSLGYVLSRALCGIGSVKFKHAKKDGMLSTETNSITSAGFGLLMMWAVVAVIAMMLVLPLTGSLTVATSIVFLLYYKKKCYTEFGGVTGDTAGYFVTMCELLTLICVSVCSSFGVG